MTKRGNLVGPHFQTIVRWFMFVSYILRCSSWIHVNVQNRQEIPRFLCSKTIKEDHSLPKTDDILNNWEFGKVDIEDVQTLTTDEDREAFFSALSEKYTSEDMDKIDEATRILETFCSENRIITLQNVLDQRTTHSTFVFENPSNPNNVWACLRSLDSFGIQNVNIIVNPSEYEKQHRLANMKTAMGTSKWLTLREHSSAEECIAKLKKEGYRVLASDLQPSTKPINEFDWSIKTALVIGNEERGISESMRELCDATFQIPMRGFAESLNMSVACAITLAHLSMGGGLPPNLTEEEKKKLYLLWIMRTVNASEAILRQKGIELPKEYVKTQRILGYKSTRKIRR